MDACHLVNTFSPTIGLLAGVDDTEVGLHRTAYIVQAAFVNVGNGIEVVFQDSLHLASGRITGTFAQPVNGGIRSLAAAKYGGKHIAHGKVIVIVGMEVRNGHADSVSPSCA